ncbi:histidine kinase N-terminal 7TM domain-containing protein [Haloarculaceae archaeon H-GB2-1]|nr:histidine kinase N-terminal 7TM domain-containing protein [Haloarculaceae archaeon H-GB11]MEA5408850.1 histidine kinase N-terminal 7TM domain-containing protein [Haloarculaceae archaeon H-GB2-1]
MGSLLQVYLLGLSIGAAGCLSLSYVAWRYRPKPGTRPLAGSMLAAAFWLTTTLLSWASTDPTTAMFWRRLTYAGITLDVAFLFLFALEYGGTSGT